MNKPANSVVNKAFFDDLEDGAYYVDTAKKPSQGIKTAT
jgi:hypothetical protein